MFKPLTLIIIIEHNNENNFKKDKHRHRLATTMALTYSHKSCKNTTQETSHPENILLSTKYVTLSSPSIFIKIRIVRYCRQ